MRKTLSAISRQLSVVTVIGLATVPAILSGQTSLSIYTDGRIVVRRTLPQALQKGRNAVTVQFDGLDPATLFSPDTAVTVAGATVRYPSSANDALGRAI